MSEPTPRTRAVITPRHYQAVCALSLAAIVLLQLQQSTMATHIALLVSVLIGFLGVRAIWYRAQLSPMLILLAIAIPHGVEQYTANQAMGSDGRGPRFLDLGDVVLCVAVLAYVIGHYRLNGLWFGVLPADKRVPAAGAADKPAPPRVRSAETLSATELAALVFTIPAFVLLTEFAFLLLNQHWSFVDLPLRARQSLVVGWLIVLGMFLAAQVFRYWRRVQMDRVSALLILQDILWNETRREQRRINRWIVWKKLRERK